VATWDDGRVDDEARTEVESDLITALGHEVYQIDTELAGYR